METVLRKLYTVTAAHAHEKVPARLCHVPTPESSWVQEATGKWMDVWITMLAWNKVGELRLVILEMKTPLSVSS